MKQGRIARMSTSIASSGLGSRYDAEKIAEQLSMSQASQSQSSTHKVPLTSHEIFGGLMGSHTEGNTVVEAL
jgi:hypothetical protein